MKIMKIYEIHEIFQKYENPPNATYVIKKHENTSK